MAYELSYDNAGEGNIAKVIDPAAPSAGINANPENIVTGQDGSVHREIIFNPDGSQVTTLKTKETQETGFALQSAQCVNKHLDGTTTTLKITSTDYPAQGLQVKPGDSVTCTYVNTPHKEYGALSVVKAISNKQKLSKYNTQEKAAIDNTVYTGTYSCSKDNTTVATGTWKIKGLGTATLTPDAGQPVATKIVTGATCTVKETPPPTGLLSNGAFQWGKPSIAPEDGVTIVTNKTVTLTVTNWIKPQFGQVGWHKVDPNGNLLTGSSWTLKGPGLPGTGVLIKDCATGTCTGSGGDATHYDVDPTAGVFSVNQLEWGSYTLTEHTAPDGYLLDKKAHTFVVDANHTNVNLGNIVNVVVLVPKIPLSGGIGRSEVVLFGSGVLTFGGALIMLNRRRLRRKR